ncbi:MAG: ATP-binding cassette domain-containing protein [Mariprofundaceae bacterium]|nr:ATP-binding cassette domain-containing protein [Mariprofundaceae bacterium]
MQIEEISLFGGRTKSGEAEAVKRVDLRMGEVISIVGATGSGKTTLINDIGLFANENTPSRRHVWINGKTPDENMVSDPSQNPIALITQHTSFLSDLPVAEFLHTHARIRRYSGNSVVEETLDFANQLTGEPIITDCAMTELSGGQSRALLIADAVVIGNSPIILLDEIENAGIDRIKALELLQHYQKVFVFVTHDPRIALLSDCRIVMVNGGMQQLIMTSAGEKHIAEQIKLLDALMINLRNKIRGGQQLVESDMQDLLSRTMADLQQGGLT